MNDLQGHISVGKLCADHLLVDGGTQTFAGVDLQDYIGNVAAVITATQDSAGATVVVSFLESSDNSTFATWASAPTPVTITGTNVATSVAIDTRATKRYVQAKLLTTSTTATFDIGIAAVGIKQLV